MPDIHQLCGMRLQTSACLKSEASAAQVETHPASEAVPVGSHHHHADADGRHPDSQPRTEGASPTEGGAHFGTGAEWGNTEPRPYPDTTPQPTQPLPFLIGQLEIQQPQSHPDYPTTSRPPSSAEQPNIMSDANHSAPPAVDPAVLSATDPDRDGAPKEEADAALGGSSGGEPQCVSSREDDAGAASHSAAHTTPEAQAGREVAEVGAGQVIPEMHPSGRFQDHAGAEPAALMSPASRSPASSPAAPAAAGAEQTPPAHPPTTSGVLAQPGSKAAFVRRSLSTAPLADLTAAVEPAGSQDELDEAEGVSAAAQRSSSGPTVTTGLPAAPPRGEGDPGSESERLPSESEHLVADLYRGSGDLTAIVVLAKAPLALPQHPPASPLRERGGVPVRMPGQAIQSCDSAAPPSPGKSGSLPAEQQRSEQRQVRVQCSVCVTLPPVHYVSSCVCMFWE